MRSPESLPLGEGGPVRTLDRMRGTPLIMPLFRSARRGGTPGRPSPISPPARCEGAGKNTAAQRAAVLQNLETYFRLKKAFMPGYSAISPSLPLCAMAHNGDPDDLKCSGEVNSPCAKVFACGENACTRLPAPPLRRHKVRSAPFLPAAKTSLRSLAPPPPRRPTALGSSGAPQDGAPRSWATEKAKPPNWAALQKGTILTSG